MTRNLIKLNMTLTMVTAGKTRIQKHLHFPRFHRIEFDLKSHVFFSTSLIGFLTSKCNVVNWIVSKFWRNFGRNFGDIFWEFFGNNVPKIFLRKKNMPKMLSSGRICQRCTLKGRICQEDL